jgi:F-type H+-transporting ATPase subunit c
MEIPQIIGAGLIVIGAGLGGKMVVQQWTLCSSTRSFRKIQTAMLIAAALIEGIGFAVIRFLIKTKNSCNGIVFLKLNITIATMQLN